MRRREAQSTNVNIGPKIMVVGTRKWGNLEVTQDDGTGCGCGGYNGDGCNPPTASKFFVSDFN